MAIGIDFCLVPHKTLCCRLNTPHSNICYFSCFVGVDQLSWIVDNHTSHLITNIQSLTQAWFRSMVLKTHLLAVSKIRSNVVQNPHSIHWVRVCWLCVIPGSIPVASKGDATNVNELPGASPIKACRVMDIRCACTRYRSHESAPVSLLDLVCDSITVIHLKMFQAREGTEITNALVLLVVGVCIICTGL